MPDDGSELNNTYRKQNFEFIGLDNTLTDQNAAAPSPEVPQIFEKAEIDTILNEPKKVEFEVNAP